MRSIHLLRIPLKDVKNYLIISQSLHYRFQLRRSFTATPQKPSNRNDPAETLSSQSWIDSSIVPSFSRPYLKLARIDKSVGTLLLFWPCCWGVALATPLGQIPSLLLMAKFGAGAFIMRGAGCTINDLWDRDFDKHVERTKLRPIASGEITVPQALTFLSFQLSCGLAVLVSFDLNTIMLGFASMPLVVAYPLMKRYTNWPQFVLGLAFNWGVLVGWSAVEGSLSLDATLPLYAAGVCWTLVYDTIYGYQDTKDDAKLGLKSTALYFGNTPQWKLTALAVGMLSGLVVTGVQSHLGYPFYIGIAGTGAHLLWQIWTADICDPKNLWNRFNSNKYLGGLVTASIIAGSL